MWRHRNCVYGKEMNRVESASIKPSPNKPNTKIQVEIREYEDDSGATIYLTQRCFDINLEWSGGDQLADFVCALGAVFGNQETLI